MLRTILTSIALLLSFSTVSCNSGPVPTTTGRFDVNVDKTDVAIGGYDPTTYFTSTGPQRGDFMIASNHDGANYWFVSKDNKKTFEASPEKYLPAYGGYCAFGVALGKKFSASPEVYKVHNGVLYLNLNDGIASEFNKDVAGNIGKAEANWPGIKDLPASAL